MRVLPFWRMEKQKMENATTSEAALNSSSSSTGPGAGSGPGGAAAVDDDDDTRWTVNVPAELEGDATKGLLIGLGLLVLFVVIVIFVIRDESDLMA